MATEAEPPPNFSSSEGGGVGGEKVDNGKLVVVKIEEDGGQQPPLKSEGLEAVRGGGRSRGPVVFTKDQLVAGSGPRSSDCCSMMEPEPGRCRRTDGKKWRCKNDVIPNTKYCERHIHRGCNRSRKLVEGSVSNPTASPSMISKPPQQASSYETPPLLRPLPPSNSTKNLENLCDVSCNLTPSMSLDSYVAPEATAISSNSVRTKGTRAASTPASEDVRPNSSDPTSHDKASTIVGLGSKPTHNLVTATIGCPKSEIIKEKVEFTHTANPVDAAYSNGIGKEHTVVTGSSKVPSTSVASTLSDVFASTIAISMVTKRDSCDTRSHGNGNSQYIGQGSATKRRTHIRVIDKIKLFTSQGFDFSPKSVLQGANDHHPHTNPSIQGSSPLCFNKRDPEVQPWRCRRTDGRKWRCRRDVIPNEKYCAMHMHRGAKKQVHNFQPTDLPSSKRSKSTHPHHNLSLPSKEKYTSLNTDLSISALEISRPIKDDEPSTTGNSSDATIYSSDDNTSHEN